eukprot:gene7204-5796_t
MASTAAGAACGSEEEGVRRAAAEMVGSKACAPVLEGAATDRDHDGDDDDDANHDAADDDDANHDAADDDDANHD